MSESDQLEEKVVSTTAEPTSATPACTPQTNRTFISIAAAALCISFFMPWVNILGANVSGMDIQKNFSSYRLVWLVPVLALITLLLAIAGQNTNVIRRIAGICPFIILAYALSQMGSDLFQAVGAGGWLALIGGVALICIPNARKPTISS
jgi:hypothetical protein